MPWKALNIMTLRQEFVLLAQQEGANRRELCRRFGISPQTAYKWLRRYVQDGAEGLADCSRRPTNSPYLSPPALESAVLDMRREHPAWGGRKISRCLADQGYALVAPSTVTSILHRHELIAPEASAASTAWQRFVHDTPNSLWQVDFKGHFETGEGRCSPLTMLDDHSRFNVGLYACGETTASVVQALMQRVFRAYGLPVQMNFDNGAPWGCPKLPGQLTELGVWLVRLGIRMTHSRPRHPQTNGKDERFHRSLKAEVLNGRSFDSLARVQKALDDWRTVYNQKRPHEALQMQTPITRYTPSTRAFPKRLPPLEYSPSDEVRTVGWNGTLRFKGRRYQVSTALHRYPVALRANAKEDGLFDVFFAHHRCMTIDLRADETA